MWGRASCSQSFRQNTAQLKLYFAPADRGRLCYLAANSSQPVIFLRRARGGILGD